MNNKNGPDTFSFDMGLTDWYKFSGLPHRGKVNNEGDAVAQCGNENPGFRRLCLDKDAVDTDPEGFGKSCVTKCQVSILMGLHFHQTVNNWTVISHQMAFPQQGPCQTVCVICMNTPSQHLKRKVVSVCVLPCQSALRS